MASLAILSCTKGKKALTNLRADMLYTGNVFQRLMPIVKKDFDHVLILSAKYNLITPETRISPYSITISQVKLGKTSDARIIAGKELIEWKKEANTRLDIFIKKHNITRIVYFCSKIYYEGLPVGETPFKDLGYYQQMEYICNLKNGKSKKLW